MGRFRYLRDPLWVAGCFAYAANRWLVKPHVHTGLFHSCFNDFWLIPCALPPVLWLHRRLGLRWHDDPPRISEILLHLAFWSALFEWIGPRFMTRATGDPFDALAYAGGALLAGLWWRREQWLPMFSAK
jgi:hypothetical protein